MYKYKVDLEQRQCKYCGKDFIPHSHVQQYCSEDCTIGQRRINAREYKRREKLKRKGKKNKSLAQMQMEARKLGMSYGMYVATMQKGV